MRGGDEGRLRRRRAYPCCRQIGRESGACPKHGSAPSTVREGHLRDAKPGSANGTSRSWPSYLAVVHLRLMLLPLGLALIVALSGCSTSSGSPEQACAKTTPEQANDECRDSGEGEGPLDN